MTRRPETATRPQPGRTPEPRRAPLSWAFALLAGFCGALLLTFGGVHWLVIQLADARGFKSEVVTMVLGLGLMIVGPVLLWALATMLPRWWFRAIGTRVTQLIFDVPPEQSRR